MSTKEKDLDSKRQELKAHQKELDNLIRKINPYYQFINDDYIFLSHMINWIEANIENLQQNDLQNVIFLLGPTGAGKSTLVNYIKYGDSNFIISNGKGAINVKADSIAHIGNGAGSTTLFPNIYTSQLGTFLDCAGDGDTTGQIAQLINSITKLKLAQKVKNAKVIFVTKEACLDSNAGYGKIFKESLASNARFLQQISLFQKSSALVVTGSTVRKSALENAMQNLNNMLQKHNNFGSFKQIIKYVLDHKKLATFSRASDSLEVGQTYQPPNWNPKQCENIQNMIKSIQFVKIPSKNFFNTSSTIQIKETMSKVLEVLYLKVGSLIEKIIESSMPFSIFSLEIPQFETFITGLLIGSKFNLQKYLKILSYKNYFKTNINSEEILKVNKQIKFISNFIDNYDEEKNWIEFGSKNKKQILKQILIDVSDARTENNYFLKSIMKNKIITKVSIYNLSIQQRINKLKQLYKNQDQIQKNKNVQTGPYFKDVIKKQFSHTIQQPYIDKEKYQDLFYYKEKQPYIDSQGYMDSEPYQDIEYFQTQKTLYRPTTKYKTQYYDDTQKAPVRNFFKQVVTLGMGDTARDHVRKSKQVPYTEYQPYTQKVQSSRQVIKYRNVEKMRNVTKYRQVQKSKPIVKERDVTKCRPKDIYKDLTVRQFDQKLYADAIRQNGDLIKQLRKEIQAKINEYPQSKLGDHPELSIKIDEKDSAAVKCKDLLQKWLIAEYQAYFAQQPKESLKELSIQAISKLQKMY